MKLFTYVGLILFSLLAPLSSLTQAISTFYTYAGYSVESYQELSTASETVIISGNFSNETSEEITIPTFDYCGIPRNSMWVSANGFLRLDSSPTWQNTNYDGMSTNDVYPYDIEVIAPFEEDLEANITAIGKVSYGIVGDEIVVQWKNVRLNYLLEDPAAVLNFQARLNYVNGNIRFVYGACQHPYLCSAKVGLRHGGNSFANKIRMRTSNGQSNWSQIFQETSTSVNNPTCQISSNITPITGTTLLFNAINPGCTDPAACNYNPFSQFDNGTCEIFPTLEFVYSTTDYVCAGTEFMLYYESNISNTDYYIDWVYDESNINLIGPDYFMVTLDENATFSYSLNTIGGCQLNGELEIVVNQNCIEGCFIPEAINYDPTAYYENNSLCEYATSYIFFADLNSNGIQDNDEIPLPYLPVYFNELNETIFTTSQGQIEFITNQTNYSTTPSLESTEWALSNSIGINIDGVFYFACSSMVIPEYNFTAVNGANQLDMFCTSGLQLGYTFENQSAEQVTLIIHQFYDNGQLWDVSITSSEAFYNLSSSAYDWIINLLPFESKSLEITVNSPGEEFVDTELNLLTQWEFLSSFGALLETNEVAQSAIITCNSPSTTLSTNQIDWTDNHFVLPNSDIVFSTFFLPTLENMQLDSIVFDFDESKYTIASFELLGASNTYTVSVDEFARIVFYPSTNFSNEIVESQQEFIQFRLLPNASLSFMDTFEGIGQFYFTNNITSTNSILHTIYDCDLNYTGETHFSFCENDEPIIDLTSDYSEHYYLSNFEGTNEIDPVLSINPAVLPETFLVTFQNPLCSEMVEIDVDYWPAIPTTLFNNNGILTALGGDTWQWYYNGQIIEGAVNATLDINAIGELGPYYVVMSYDGSCSVTSVEFTAIGLIEHTNEFVSMRPISNGVEFNAKSQPITSLEIRDIHGRIVLKNEFPSLSHQIDFSGWSNGIYLAQLTINSKTYIFKISSIKP